MCHLSSLILHITPGFSVDLYQMLLPNEKKNHESLKCMFFYRGQGAYSSLSALQEGALLTHLKKKAKMK